MVTTYNLEDDGWKRDDAQERMFEIFTLLKPTRRMPDSVEYSALLCAACVCLAIGNGVSPSDANLDRILHAVLRVILPVVDGIIVDIHLPEADNATG